MTNLNMFERYLVLEKGHTPQGVRRYLYDVRLWLSWLEQQGQAVGPEALRAFLEERHLSPRRVHGFLAAIRAYYRWREKVLGEAVTDPTLQVGRPRAGRRIPAHPNPEDLTRLLGALEGEPEAMLLRALLPFLYGTGLRVSEVLGLQVQHLIYEQGKLEALRVIGKGDKERMVPLSPMARIALEDWLELRGAARGPLWVYRAPKYQGRTVGVSWLQKRLKKLAEHAGVDPHRCSPHKFRHAYATELVNREVGLDAIKELLGHNYIGTTQIYLHTSYKRLKSAVSTLGL